MKFLFDTQKGRDFFDKQLEKDNKAIEKIQRAKSARELRKIERDWRREEARDRQAFNKENW
jgi:hypothetical protein